MRCSALVLLILAATTPWVWADDLASQSPSDEPAAHGRFGRQHYDAGSYAEAATAFARAAQLGGLDAQGYVYLGHCHLALGATDAAKAAYVAGVMAHPTSEAPIRGGLLHLAGGDWTRVEPLLREVIDRAHLSCAAWHLLGYSLVEQERWDEAADALARAADLGAPAADVLGLLGWAEERCGRSEDARAAYREALRADPRAQHAAARIDALLQATQRPIQELRDEYDELLELAPQNPWVRNNYGYQLRQAAERMWAMIPTAETELSRSLLERSRDVYIEVAGMLPDDPQIQSDTGLVFDYYPCVRDDAQARKYFTRALELTGWVYRDALNGMIRLCERTGDWATLHDVTGRALEAFDGGAPAVVPAGSDGAPKAMRADATRVVRGAVELARRAAEAHLDPRSPLRAVPPLELEAACSFGEFALPEGWHIERPISEPRGEPVTLRYAFEPGTTQVLGFRHQGGTDVMGKKSRHDYTNTRRIAPSGPARPSGAQPAHVRFEVHNTIQSVVRDFEACIAPDGHLVEGTVRTVPTAAQTLAEICTPVFTTLPPLPVLPVRVGDAWQVPIDRWLLGACRISFRQALLHAEAWQTLTGFDDVAGERCARIEMTYLAAVRSPSFVLRAGGASPGEAFLRGRATILLGEDGRIRRIDHQHDQQLEVRDAMQPMTLSLKHNDVITVTCTVER